MTMTDAELAEIRARVEAATPGPWVTRPVSELWDGDYEGSNGCNLWLATEWKGAKGPNLGADEMLNQDAEFTAHARQDVPALLDELAAARAVIDDTLTWMLDNNESDTYQHNAQQIFDRLNAYLHSATEDADDRTT